MSFRFCLECSKRLTSEEKDDGFCTVCKQSMQDDINMLRRETETREYAVSSQPEDREPPGFERLYE